MKLLLTSAGITNDSIAKALFELVGKKPEDTTVVFIPTASNIISWNKDRLIDDLINLQKQNFWSIEITDISAVDEEIWRPSIERADIIYFEGGSNYYLMRWIYKSGLSDILPTLLKDKVYVGVSAGSMVTNPSILSSITQIIYEEDLRETEDINALHMVDFYILPHLNSERFPNVRKECIEKIADSIDKTIYALDDNTALKIIDKTVDIVSEWEYILIHKT